MGSLLGSKDLGFYVFRTLNCVVANHDQNNVFRLFWTCSKLVHCCKVGLNYCRIEKIVSAFFDRSKLRLDQSKIGSDIFSAEFPTQP